MVQGLGLGFMFRVQVQGLDSGFRFRVYDVCFNCLISMYVCTYVCICMRVWQYMNVYACMCPRVEPLVLQLLCLCVGSGFRFRVSGLGFRFQVLELRVQVQGLGSGLGSEFRFRVQSWALRVQVGALAFKVKTVSRVWGFGFCFVSLESFGSRVQSRLNTRPKILLGLGFSACFGFTKPQTSSTKPWTQNSHACFGFTLSCWLSEKNDLSEDASSEANSRAAMRFSRTQASWLSPRLGFSPRNACIYYRYIYVCV